MAPAFPDLYVLGFSLTAPISVTFGHRDIPGVMIELTLGEALEVESLKLERVPTGARYQRGAPITALLYRNVPVDEVRRAATLFVERAMTEWASNGVEWDASDPEGWKASGMRQAVEDFATRRVRKANPDRSLLAVAARYAELVMTSSSPRADLALELDWTPKKVSRQVNRCIEKGLLLPASGQGKADHRLTDAARALLAEDA